MKTKCLECRESSTGRCRRHRAPRQLMEIAKECRAVYDRCAAESSDLFGGSLLDLCADNVEASLSDLQAAIVVSGIEAIANDRIRKQIAAYRGR